MSENPSSAGGLDPAAAAFLERLRAAGGPAPHQGTVEEARQAHVATAADLAGPGEPIGEVSDTRMDDVPVRIYRPEAARGVVVYAHGGGWAVGTVDTYDALCRMLASRSGSTVVSVDYTLAPDLQHPAQLRQLRSVLGVVRSPDGPAPGEPVAVAGDSAGGFLAAWAAHDEARDGRPLAAQAVIYPAFDPALDTGSARAFARGYYLQTATMHWYWDLYAPDGVELIAEADLHGLAPALVLTAGFDPLRDEGRAYAAALRDAGVQVELVEYPGEIHGFCRFTAVIPQATEALGLVGHWLRDQLAPGGNDQR
jgi:acetyl esterase